MPKLPRGDSPKKGKSSDPGALVFKPQREPTKVIIGITLVVYIVVVGAFYGILWSYKRSIQSEIQQKKQKTEELRQEERTPLAREVMSFKRRSENLEDLLENHRDWISVFSFLERVTLPEVQYTEFSGNYGEKLLRVQGLTSSYRNLARQIYIFEDNPNVEDLVISAPHMDEGGVGFEIELKVDLSLWEFDN